MVTYDELANTNLSALDTVATDFEQLVRKWEYDSDFQGDVVNPLSASGWSGPASQAAVGQLTQARTQIEAAFNETSAIAKALRDAHDQFVGCQNTLRQIQQDAQGQGLTISADGSQVTWPTPTDLPHNAGVHEDYQQAMAQAAGGISQRITTVLQQATDADQTAAAALAADTGTDQQNFNAAPVGGIAEEKADQAATQAASLAGQGDKLSNAQLAQLDALLKAHANDPTFTTDFYNKLGAQGTLKFWGQLSESSTGTMQPDQARLDILKDMQGQLGTSLASATNTQTWPHLSDQWEAQLRAAGAQRIQLAGPDQYNYQPYGYQILGSILRTGTYDPHFLNPIADDVTQLTKKNPDMWAEAAPEPPCPDVKMNFLGNGSGFNPVTGVLEGLGHSPAAATQYFQNADNLTFLTDSDKNPLLPDTTSRMPGDQAASLNDEPTALGHALQAATTGMAWDAPNGTQIPQHTDATNTVMKQVINTFGSNPSLLHGDGAPFAAMNGSVAHITASYMGDIDQAVNYPSGSKLTTFGPPLNLGQDPTAQPNAVHLLDTLGRDPNAYGVLVQSQNGYMAGELHNTVHQPGVLNDNLNRVAEQGSRVNGILANARANAVAQAGWQSDAAYNTAIDNNTGIANTIYGMTLGKEVGSVPVLGPLANQQISGMISSMGSSYHHDSTAANVTAANDIITQGQNKTAEAVQAAVANALQGTNLDPDGSVTLNVGQQSQLAFMAGVTQDGGMHQGGK
ncbi:hypothetical protein [Kitasatospora sp. LaBMicrA B282]|uniref:hypothetical protein n=1 Tax=Kitasatospora sp. LaBMicrA B282 TaxID=3420949 RepID=UPI003D134393